HPARHLGSPSTERLPHHHDRAAALPHRSVVCARGREPLLLVPRGLFLRSHDRVEDGQAAKPEIREVRSVAGRRCGRTSRAASCRDCWCCGSCPSRSSRLYAFCPAPPSSRSSITTPPPPPRPLAA